MAVRSTTVGAFLFWMNNFGGNVPMFVEPVRNAYDYKTALAIFYAGFYLLSKFHTTGKQTCTYAMWTVYRGKKFENNLINYYYRIKTNRTWCKQTCFVFIIMLMSHSLSTRNSFSITIRRYLITTVSNYCNFKLFYNDKNCMEQNMK